MSLLRKVFSKNLRCYFRIPLLQKNTQAVFLRKIGCLRPFCSCGTRKDFFMSKNVSKKINLRRLVYLAFLIATNIVLVRLLSFQTPVSRLDFGFIPISLAGAMFGPFWGGLAGGLSDIFGMLFNSKGMAFFFGWTLNAILHGVFYGLFLYQKKKSLLRISLCVVIKGIIIDLILGSVWGAIFRGGMHLIGFVMWERLIVFCIKAPLEILTCFAFFGALSPHVKELNQAKKQEFVQYANSFQTVINLGLERITKLLECVGNPQDKLSVIHVAGTNGKGSVCAFLQTMLTKSGKKTGKFISPNMLRVNERISIDGMEISDEDLNRLLLKIESHLGEVKEATGEIPSQFEAWTAVAFCYFLEQNCDVVVLETGLGGRYDATNVIKKPLCTAITRIAVDHVAYLGDSVDKIAYEKAGIIKEGVPLVTLPQDEDAMNVLKRVANDKNAPVFVTTSAEVSDPKGCYEVFSYGNIKNLVCGISGYHQIENASLAIETALQLEISESVIREGLKQARHIGRLEQVTENILFDGAHNLNGMTALRTSLDRYYPNTEKIFVSAFMKDKDIKESLAVFSGESFYFVSVCNNERSDTPENLCQIARESGVFGTAFSDLESAIFAAEKTGKLIVVCGSLYLYQDLSVLLEKNNQKS